MLLVSIVFLFVFLFGAYAYGAATLYSLRGEGRSDRAAIALFSISTVWFVFNALIEFRNLTGRTERGVLDLVLFIVYLFPPVIMHMVHNERVLAGEPPVPFHRRLIAVMYVVSPAIGIYMIAAIFGLAPRPDDFGRIIGISIGSLFVIASAFATTLTIGRARPAASRDQLWLRRVMIFLYIGLSGIFIALIFMREQQLLVAILERLSRSAPIYFMIASLYYEARFVFYDLVVKRALLILVSAVVLAVYLVAALPWLDGVPAGAARPWLFAAALTPIALLMPALWARAERWLDRRWLGREFTPVDAVKHVLAAMQPAIDEASLIAAAEARLSEIFGAKIAVLVGSRAIFEPEVQMDIKLTSPVSGAIVRIAVLRQEGGRRFLSEDVALLRSLGGVFGFMLENIRLQRKRVEQEQLAQELRLQSSKSELKALRAQINPHFLFNALNAIASLIHTDPARADEVVEQLAEVFRYTLRRSDSEWAPLDQELAFAKAYLDVEQARFGQRLACSIEYVHEPVAPKPAGEGGPQVPSMLLQTLLENAVKHGVSQSREPGRIDVIVRQTADHVTLEVRNTGPAASPVRDGEGFGLHSIKERLKGHFGDRASFRLMRDESAGVTVARIDMPNVRAAA
jgi:hypothetical protein